MDINPEGYTEFSDSKGEASTWIKDNVPRYAADEVFLPATFPYLRFSRKVLLIVAENAERLKESEL